MELAVHLRDASQIREFDGVRGHLTALYEGGTLPGDVERFVPPRFRRIYVGDEFCFNRLPVAEELSRLLELAKARRWAVTLLTPPLTDEGMDKSDAIFQCLRKTDPRAEVVVNDWGVLLFLREKYPDFQLAVGRLLNKGFKDPRLMDLDGFLRFSGEAADLLNGCTFDFEDLQNQMSAQGVKRLERDLLPYGKPRVKGLESFGISVYFPYGYVTAGRVCWIASFCGSEKRKFSLGTACDRLCSRLFLKLARSEQRLQLFQGGNAIFYLYPAPLLNSFLKWAKRFKIRLVYQGLAI